MSGASDWAIGDLFTVEGFPGVYRVTVAMFPGIVTGEKVAGNGPPNGTFPTRLLHVYEGSVAPTPERGAQAISLDGIINNLYGLIQQGDWQPDERTALIAAHDALVEIADGMEETP